MRSARSTPADTASSDGVIGPRVGERSIQTEADPEVDAQHIHRCNGGLEQSLDQAITALRGASLDGVHVCLLLTIVGIPQQLVDCEPNAT